MPTRIALLLLLAIPFVMASENLAKPDKVTIHTWVREDLFGGWMVNDEESLQRGMRKLDAFLASKPEDKNGLAWKYLGVSYYMRKAAKSGDMATYEKHLAESKVLRERIFASEFRDVGPYIILGSVLIGGAYYAPAKDQPWMYRDGREMLRKVQAMQGPAFEKLPPHMRGELWSSIAFASDRLGDKEDRDRVVGDMLVKLAGSPYEGRAKRWQSLAELKSEADNMCISCHEPGRLAPTLARVQASAQ